MPTKRGLIPTKRGFTRIRLILLLLAVACLTGACASPEAGRTRGGGGADVGNRPSLVEMHGGSDQFWKTPDRIGVEHVPLEPARQARERSPGSGP